MTSDPDLASERLEHDQLALREWDGVGVFRSRTGPGTFDEHEHKEVQLSIRMEESAPGEVRAQMQSLHLIESGKPHGGTLERPSEFLMVYLDPGRLDREAFDTLGVSSTHVRESDPSDDWWLASALGSIHSELREGWSNDTIAEALGLAVLTRVLTSYCGEPTPNWARVRPLDARRIREACGLLREGVASGVQVSDVAAHLNMGVARFAKAFKAALGVPPHGFLMQQRIRMALDALTRSDVPLVQVALDCGFASQSHMTEQVRRFVGTTPAKLRRDHRP